MAVFLDTNILLYSISTAEDEADKRTRACKLLDRDDCVLSVQVLQEFYIHSTRVSRIDALPHDIAVGLIRTWLRFQVQDNNLAILHDAFAIRAMHGLSFWDSSIVAAARAADCRELYSEDLSDGQKIGDILIINPFR